jgi:hypothetical protein
MKRILSAFFLIAGLAAQVAARPVVSLFDAVGDDYGDGRLAYPQQGEYESGDLDLVAMQINREDQGFWFEATFKNLIRDPANAAGPVGAETLASFARRGFYQFNLDIYVDTDRIKGSGNTFTLPGRHVRIDPGYAWERAVVLTPRPESVRSQLLDALLRQDSNRSQRQVEASVDQTIFFPTQVRVRGRTVAFFVPDKFFGGSDGTDWAITAFVTAAKSSNDMKLTFGTAEAKPTLEDIDLDVMQPQLGRPRNAIGYGATGVKPSPIFDLLTRSVEQQAAQLASSAPLVGVSWGPHAANESAPMAAAVRGTPTESSNTAVERRSADQPASTNPWDAPLRSVRSESATTAVSAGSAPSIQMLLDPRPPAPLPVTPTANAVAPGAASPAAAAEAAAPVPKPSVGARLQALKQLFDDKVIDEAEYKQHRQRLLGEL